MSTSANIALYGIIKTGVSYTNDTFYSAISIVEMAEICALLPIFSFLPKFYRCFSQQSVRNDRNTYHFSSFRIYN